jgi:SAM-dependent methyltransferase
MGASIDYPIRNLLRLISPGSSGRLLDVGCGYGFSLDAVRTLASWEVKGFEPSQYGSAGKAQLGVDIVPKFAVKNHDANYLYDIVYSSEVVEHVTDPAAFLEILTSYLKDDGTLVLTTPNPESIRKGAPTVSLLALLSPGAHTILFSEHALSTLLRAAGLPFIRVEKAADATLYYASKHEIVLVRPDVGLEDVAGYYEAVLRRQELADSLRAGVQYRLFRSYMDCGRYDLAQKVDRVGLGVLEPRLNRISTLEQFPAEWPLCIAAGSYYCGMFELLVSRQFDTAAAYFRSAFDLCQKKIDIAPYIAVVEADLLWRAKYHEALAYDWAGKTQQAAFVVGQLISPGTLAKIPKSLEADLEGLRSKLGLGKAGTKAAT